MKTAARSLAGRLFAVALLAAGAAAAAEPEFPSREIMVIIPWNAGGSNDILARGLQPLLREQGVNIVVENVPGATGAIGLRRVAVADPDGYTIGMGTSSTLAAMAQGLVLLKSDQFTALVRISQDPLMLLVPKSSPYQTLDAFIAHMKKNNGKVSIGTPGTHNVNHIFAAMTARAAGVDYVNVPYTGGSNVVGDLVGGHVDAGVLKPSESLGQINAGLVKPIAVFANERLAAFPDVPTFKERGYDAFPFGPVVQMAYLVAPKGLRDPVRERLIKVLRTAVQDPRFKAFAEKNSFLVDDLSGDALTQELAKVEHSLKAVATQVFKDQ
jgi:tripartite-type tricarboxylate transporter receptor subunit TctC